MKRWMIFNAIQTLIAIFLAFIASYFVFNIDVFLVKLIGVILLSSAIIIQIHVSLMIYSRDVSILTELKDCEGMLEGIKSNMKNFPSYIESNNSEVDRCIKSNNSEMCKYIDARISQMIEVIYDQYRR
jgi:hypothetical protein